MTFGLFQSAYNTTSAGHEAISSGPTGVIGTTTNGVLYLCLPVLSTLLDSGRFAKYRRPVALTGLTLSAAAFLISSWAQRVWQLILLQGVVAAIGGAMLFSPTTLWLDEWFRGGGGRATAYGVSLASKNVVGTSCPFLMYGHLEKLGWRGTLRVWAGIVLATGLLGIALIPTAKAGTSPSTTIQRPRKIPWAFLKHRTFYIYAAANTFQSAGYGLPQSYIPEYAARQLHLSAILSSLMLVLFNMPGILSCICFGLLSDKTSLSAASNTLISALGSAVCVFALWATKSHELPALLIAFSLLYGAFAGGYSSTWGGWLADMERDAVANNEAVNTGMIYGLFNGARGVGYVVGGLSGVELLQVGGLPGLGRGSALSTRYGCLIIFTGVCSLLGGWATVWRAGKGVNGVLRRRGWWICGGRSMA